MNIRSDFQNIIVLFDEHGTPTFDKKESDVFPGVAVAYNKNYEQILFEKCNDLFGLSNKNPLKNNDIKPSRALKIAKLLPELNIHIEVATINLCNTEFQGIVTLYENYGNLLREIHRGVRERPKSQIIHEEIESYAIFYIMTKYIEKNPSSSIFSVYLDSWSLPINDISISLDLASNSIENKLNEINKVFFPNVKICCDKFTLLVEDSSRKRFIDVVTSVISRKYKPKDHPKYLDNSYFDSYINETDITNDSIQFLKDCMDKTAREG